MKRREYIAERERVSGGSAIALEMKDREREIKKE